LAFFKASLATPLPRSRWPGSLEAVVRPALLGSAALPIAKDCHAMSMTLASPPATANANRAASTARVTFRPARPADGAAIWRLVQACGTLELNSLYFYLLMATDFGDTCLVAEQAGEPVGVVIGYHPPREPRTAFVWQVGLLPRLQGQGLGLQLLQAWLALPANAMVTFVTATVADDNTASQTLFRKLAAAHGVGCTAQPHFTAELFASDHPAEPLFRVGPIQRDAPRPF
jgi:L-2,4-diaminobutyric acid acetyltransferase